MTFLCCYPHCNKRYSKSSDLNFFSFPKDEKRFSLWIELINRPDLKNLEVARRSSKRVCSRHFEPCMFAGYTKSRLKSYAYPIAYDSKQPQQPSINDLITITPPAEPIDTITDTDVESNRRDYGTQTPKIMLKHIRIDKEDFQIYCKRHFNETVANLLISMYQFKENKEKFQQFALILYSIDRKLYKFVKKLLDLPTRQGLFKFINQWEIYGGYNNPSLKALQTKINLFNDKSKACILLIDRLPLKQFLFYNISRDRIIGLHESSFHKFLPGNTVLVFMLRGIYTNWEQLVSYFFINNHSLVRDIHDIVINVVGNLQNYGLQIKAIVTSQKSIFYKFIDITKISLDNPFITVNNEKIYFMFNILSLLKSIRNCFLQYAIQIRDNLIDFKYVEGFYDKDKKQKCRIVPILTDHHLYPSKIEKKQIKIASELFSNELITGLSTYIAFNKLPEQANATIEFIVQINELFNMFYIPSNSELCKNVDFLLRILEMFTDMKIYDIYREDITSSLRFIKGWQITINSLLYVCYDLPNKRLDGHQFTMDTMDKFFKTIHNQYGNKPTPIQFYNSFRKMFSLNYLKYTKNISFINNIDGLLSYFLKDNSTTSSLIDNNESLLKFSIDYRDFYPPRHNTFIYLLRYFSTKISSQHKCVDCEKYFQQQQACELSLLQYYLTYKNSVNFTKRSPIEFLAYIENLDDMFCNLFPRLALDLNVVERIKQYLVSVEFSKPCEDFPLDIFLLFFIRCRIYYTLKLINKNFKNSKDNTIKIRRLWE